MSTGVQPFRLDDAQLAFFHREGYLVVEGLFSDADLQPAIDEVMAAIDFHARRAVAAGRLSRPYDELDFERRLVAICAETDEVLRAVWEGNLAGPAFFNLIRHPHLLDVAEQFCGPELIASSVYRLRPKLPTDGRGEVPWHQDSGYTDSYCDTALMLTVWIPLVDADESNGCLYVMPRAHKHGILTHAKRSNGRPYLVIPKSSLPPTEAICCPVHKGGALLLSNLTPHASFTNKTDGVRWSMDLRYQSAALPTNAYITRLPGEAVSQDNNGVPPACYPPEADFLVRSRQRPGQVVRDTEVFRRLRTDHVGKPPRPRWTSVVDE